MSEGNPMKVTVSAADPGTEVVVMDSRRIKVASGGGRLDLKLAPGLYKARFKAGGFSQDRLFEVADQAVEVEGPRLSLRTPVPLAGSASTHEYHEGPARALSTLQAHAIGQGSEIGLFARDSHKKPGEGQLAELWRGLQLQRLSGIAVADFSNEGVRDANLGYVAARLELDPGTYLLTLMREFGPAVQLPVVANAGWRTTVFLDCTDTNSHRELDLYGASIMMSRPSEPFHPGDELLRLTELAKLSLLNGRVSIDASSLANMLDEKFSYPILGILAGHVLLLADKPNMPLLRKIVENMEKLVPGHPDVLALHVALAAMDKSVGLEGLRLVGPPMLRSSWDILRKADETNPEILPPTAEWMQYTSGLSGGQVWLTWQRPPTPEAPPVVRRLHHLSVGIGKPESPSALSLLFQTLGSTLSDENSRAHFFELAKLVLGSVGDKIDLRELIGVWSQFKDGLADASVATSPLQNSLRRKLLGLLDEGVTLDEAGNKVSLIDIARDLRVPVSVLIEAALSLYQAVQNYSSPQENFGVISPDLTSFPDATV